MSGKVRLRDLPRHVAGRFAVGRRGTGRLRPVWNASSLSAPAVDPPKPRRLGKPASLPHNLVEPDERLYYSKRDAAFFFDTLQAPSERMAWFA